MRIISSNAYHTRATKHFINYVKLGLGFNENVKYFYRNCLEVKLSQQSQHGHFMHESK